MSGQLQDHGFDPDVCSQGGHGHDDNDDDCVGEESPLKRQRCEAVVYPPGPRHYADLFEWPTEALDSCLEHASALGVSGVEAQLPELMARKVYVTTTYSGALTVEYVCALIQDLHVSRRGKDNVNGFIFWSATDVDPLCRKVALQSTHPPEHVFGNILDRVDADLLMRVQHVQTAILNRARDRVAGGEDRAAVKQELGKRRRLKIARLLRKNMRDLKLKQCWCYRHNKYCPLCPPVQPGDEHLEAGGNTCVAFSPQGKQWRWCHESAVPCLIWLVGLEQIRPSMILQECSHYFNTEEVFAEIFPPSNGWSTNVVEFGPESIGVPETRPRKYSWTLDTTQRQMQVSFDRATFLKVMGRSLSLDGHACFCAPACLVQKHYQAQMAQLGVVMPTAAGSVDWKPEVVLGVGNRARLADYRKLKQTSAIDFEPIVDLSQNAKVRGRLRNLVPSFLRISVPFSFAVNRTMTREETFGLHGFAVPGLFENLTFPPTGVDRFHIPPELLESLSPGEVRRLMGNSMNARALGMFLTFGLLFSQRAGQEE